MRCDRCGTALPEDSQFCSQCGPRWSLQNRPTVVTSKPANGPHPGQEFVLPCRLLFRQGHFRKSLESSPLCGFPIFLLVLELTEIGQLEFVFGFIFCPSLRI